MHTAMNNDDLESNFAEIQTEIQHLRSLLYASGRIHSVLNIASLLEIVVDVFIELMEAERGFLMLLNVQTQHMELKFSRHIDPDDALILVGLIPAHELPPKYNAASDIRYSSNGLQLTDSGIIAPLRLQGSVTGLLYADSTASGDHIRVKNIRLLEDFTNRAAVAIEHALSYQKLQLQLQTLVTEREELRAASNAKAALQKWEYDTPQYKDSPYWGYLLDPQTGLRERLSRLLGTYQIVVANRKLIMAPADAIQFVNELEKLGIAVSDVGVWCSVPPGKLKVDCCPNGIGGPTVNGEWLIEYDHLGYSVPNFERLPRNLDLAKQCNPLIQTYLEGQLPKEGYFTDRIRVCPAPYVPAQWLFSGNG